MCTVAPADVRAPWLQIASAETLATLTQLWNGSLSLASKMLQLRGYCLTKSKLEMCSCVLCVSVLGSGWHCGYSMKRLLI